MKAKSVTAPPFLGGELTTHDHISHETETQISLDHYFNCNLFHGDDSKSMQYLLYELKQIYSWNTLALVNLLNNCTIVPAKW